MTHGVIDDYSCLWVQALRDLCDAGGDAALVRDLWPVVARTMGYFLGRRTERGLVNGMEFVYFNNPLAHAVCEGTTLNCYVYRSLEDAAYLGRVIGEQATVDVYTRAAVDLARAIRTELWDEAASSYHGGIRDGRKTPATGHAALLALFYNVVPPDRRPAVFHFMSGHLEKEKAFPYTYRYLLEVLYREDTDAADRLALDTIRRKWEPMTRYDTGTTSEDWNGGSFIHESGAHPACVLSAYALGVRVEGPRGARRIVIEPRLADLRQAEGTVLCEFGPVVVAWIRSADGATLEFGIEVPAGARVTARIPCLSLEPFFFVDDLLLVEGGVAKMPDVRREGRYLVLGLGPGRHAGCSR